MAQNRVEILIKSVEGGLTVEKPLDVKTDDFGFGLQYSIDDIRTPDKGNSAYSKTITLPGTDNNNKLLGLLYDVNVDFTYYNPNIKVEARIVINNTTVLQGFMQLKKIRKLNGSDLQGSLIEYNVTVFSEAVDFFSALGEDKLEDLDLSDLEHTFNISSVTSSWTNTWEDGYVYPMMDNGNNQYKTTDFKPSFFHKALLYRVADNAGFSIGGPFLDDPVYEKEIIPYNGDVPSVNEDEALSREFRVGWTASSTQVIPTSYLKTYNNYLHGYLGNTAFRVPIPDSTPSPFYDTSGTYNPGSTPFLWTNPNTGVTVQTSGNSWIANKSGKYNFKGQMNFKLRIINNAGADVVMHRYTDSSPASTHFVTTQDTMSHRVVVSIHRSNSTIPLTEIPGPWRNLPYYITDGSTEYVEHPIDFEFQNIAVNEGGLIQLRMRVEMYITGGKRFFYSTNDQVDYTQALTGRKDLAFSLRVDSPYVGTVDSWYANETVRSGGVTDNQPLDPTDYLPKNFKQKDLFIDLIRRYNLYIYQDPDNNKKILLATREQYYSDTTIRDWTDKKDYSSEDNIEFLTELHQKEMLFSYKNDTSGSSNGTKYNDVYTKSTGDVYGQKRISFTNEFVKGEKKIESPFSPTPLTFNDIIGVVVPTIDAKAPKCKPRVLYYGGLKPSQDANLEAIDWNFSYIDALGVDQLISYSTYPYAGHFDDPISPTLDINFGHVPYTFNYTLSTMTDNNLYTRYWRNYINQISEGRLVTSKFNLSETDISEIKDNLNYKIFIKDSYYYINKIIDYNPIDKSLTKVELIKIVDGVSYIGEQGLTLENNWSSYDLITTKGDTREEGIGAVVASNDNLSNTKTEEKTIVIVGESNTVSKTSSKIMIMGDRTRVSGGTEKITILGSDDSYVAGGISNSMIIASDNKTLTQDNEIWLGDIHIIDGVIQSTINLIEGGQDELRSLFSSSKINQIDGGEDELRTAFTENIENLIDGGESSDAPI